MPPTDLLLAHLDAIAAAPGGVARLRQLILQLAVQGRLVEQDAGDEPASKFLERIKHERNRRVAAGELRKPKELASPKQDNQLFEIPFNWSWCIADDVWDFENGDRGSNYPSKDQLVASGIPFVNAGHLVNGRVSLVEMNYITRAKFESLNGGKLRENDQIYCLRGSLGKHATFDLETDAAIASSLVILRPVIPECVPYLSIYLDSDVAQTLLHRFDNGSAQPNLSSANLRKYEIPLPPLAEQRRIVARVDALTALCDDLEVRQERAGAERRRLLAALINDLLAAPAPHVTLTLSKAKGKGLDGDSQTPPGTLRSAQGDRGADAWQRISEGFDLALAAPEDVAPLRQAVLQLAVQGRLVEQNPEDEPASALLGRIRQEKARLVQAGKQRLTSPVTLSGGAAAAKGPGGDAGATPGTLHFAQGDSAAAVPFEVPQGWEWAHLQDVIVFGPSNGISPKAVEVPTNVKSLTLTATTSGKFDGRHFKYINTEIPRNSDLWLEDGDVLVQRGNTIEYVGVPAVYHGSKYEYVYPDLMMKVRPSSQIDVAYLHTAMSSQPLRDYLRSRATGTSGSMPKINHTTLVSLPIPLPPLAEQRRIVARVEQLMALCDDLEARLREERAAAERLSAGLCQAAAARPAAEAALPRAQSAALNTQLPGEPAPLDEAPSPRHPERSEGSRRAPAPPPGRFAGAQRDRGDSAQDGGRYFDLDAYAVFAAWVVRRHQGTPHSRTLGHVKLEKIAHLGEAYAKVDLGRQPQRMPRGPADFDLLTKVIERGRALDAFDAPAREGSAWGYQFVALPQLDAVAGRFAEIFGARADRLAQIVELLVPLKSRQAEAVATLYAVWSDMLRAGERPDDTRIFAAFRAFHPEKETFKQEVLERWLGWMRDNGVVPDGSAKPTLPHDNSAPQDLTQG